MQKCESCQAPAEWVGRIYGNPILRCSLHRALLDVTRNEHKQGRIFWKEVRDA